MHDADPVRLAPLELAVGMPFGADPWTPPLPTGGETPLEALEQAILPALRRPPCLVTFSGGRDSSAVLAVAMRVARRHGLPPPIPSTALFPRSVDSDETGWQELVVSHVGVSDWDRRDFHDELDLVGPVAARVLRRHGLLWPPNTHFHLPMLEQARGGALLTGVDGDGLFGSWRWRPAADVLAGRARRTPQDALRVGLAWSPPAVRRLAAAIQSGVRRRPGAELRWLRASARSEVSRTWASERAEEPFNWEARVSWYARRRSLRMTLASFARVAEDFDVLAVHPLADLGFLGAVGRAGGRRGFGDRTAAMTAIFGDLLPPEVLSRGTKGRLDDAFWTHHARDFVAGWDGRGVDPAVVDVAALRAEWSSELPNAMSSSLLQAAWLAATSDPATSPPPAGGAPSDG